MTLPSIRRAEELGRPIEHEDYHGNSPGQFMAAVFSKSLKLPPPTEVSTIPVQARLDAGRWIADCPLGCGGAEMVSTQDPVFLCLSCGSGGSWWPVEFPANKSNIEAEVSKRRNPNSWAWNPGETMIQLRAETKRIVKESS